jgi:hypothetical protein
LVSKLVIKQQVLLPQLLLVRMLVMEQLMLITQILLVRMLVVTQLVHPQSTLIGFRAGAEVLGIGSNNIIIGGTYLYQVVRLTLLI